MSETEQPETPFDPANPPAPAMSQEAVGLAGGHAPTRIWCVNERHCLWAGTGGGPDGHEDPARAVQDAAGCHADPQVCLCAQDITPEQATVDAVAVTPLTTDGAARMRTTTLDGPTLREEPDHDILADRGPRDTPLPMHRDIVGLAGVTAAGVGPIGLELLRTATVSAGEPLEDETADGSNAR